MNRILFALMLVLAFAGFSAAEDRTDIIDEAPDVAAAVSNFAAPADSQNTAATNAASKSDSAAVISCTQQAQSEQAAESEQKGGVPIAPIIVSVLATAAFVVLAILF